MGCVNCGLRHLVACTVQYVGIIRVDVVVYNSTFIVNMYVPVIGITGTYIYGIEVPTESILNPGKSKSYCYIVLFRVQYSVPNIVSLLLLGVQP
eukprot:COSAG02_NODE_9470_length_2206_cov_2.481253_2_plen_94_part_00